MEQDQVVARFLRVERNDGETLRSKGEALELTIRVVQPPFCRERGQAAAGRKVVEPRNGCGLVTQQGTSIRV